MSDVGTAPGTTVETPACRTTNVAFFEDTTRQVKQTAFFGSVDFDLIPKVLTVTAGTRHYQFDEYFKGSVTSSFGCFEAGVQSTVALRVPTTSTRETSVPRNRASRAAPI